MPQRSNATEAQSVDNETKPRCTWVNPARPLEVVYHDQEWGVPLHDDRLLFECLVLESAQSGLSWYTVLQRRPGYRRAFANFELSRVAAFSSADVDRLLLDEGIVRHRGKIESAVHNAARFLEVQAEFGSFSRYAWEFVGGTARDGQRRAHGEVPASSPESDRLARDLKRRGFKFLGSTTVYAWMQAVGLVNDHLLGCFRHAEVASRAA